MVIFLILIIKVSSECCLNCLNFSSDRCYECIPPYSLSNFTCVIECGTGYNSISGICQRNSQSLKLISTSFISYQLYNESTAGNFKTSNNSALIEQGNMFPTIDRGFYSDSNSNLIGKSAWIPWTSFSFKLIFRPFTSTGKIFQVFNSENSIFFEVELLNFFLTCKFLLISQDTKMTQLYELSNVENQVYSTGWTFLYIHYKQTDAHTVYFDIETQSGIVKKYLNNFEIEVNLTSLWVLGDVEKNVTVQGFYYKVEVYNLLDFETFEAPTISLCLYGYFEDPASFQCYICNSTCNSRLNCVDDTACSQCYSNQCSSCNGFMFGECSTCDNGEAPPYCCPYLCRKCDTLQHCIQCQIMAYNYESICIFYLPYAGLTMVSNPLLLINFGGDFKGLYGPFKTGSSEKSYHFFQNPEAADPIPSKQRGIYFNGSSILRDDKPFNSHPIMSMHWIIRPATNVSGTIFQIGSIFSLVTNSLRFNTSLQTDDKNFNSFESSNITDGEFWYSVSYSITYSYPYSTHKLYMNNILQITQTQLGVFRISSISAFFGYNNASVYHNSNNFVGFLYSFIYWNTEINDFSSYSVPNSCMSSTDSTCVNFCEFPEYFNDGGCQKCIDLCEYGCQNNITCNLCQDRLCALCLNFYDSCYYCKNNSKKVGGLCTCFTNSIDFVDRCELCHESCAYCDSLLINGCLACNETGFVLAGGVCYSRCPDGFSVNGLECTGEGGIEADLYEYFDFSRYLTVNIGSSNSQKVDIYDPIPDTNRGYYFQKSSYMSIQSFIIFYQFYFEIWIKSYNDGLILNHSSNFIIKIENSIISLYLNLTNSNLTQSSVVSQTWTNIASSLINLPTNISTLSLYQNFIFQSQVSSPDIDFFIDSDSALTLGGPNSFTGFISKFSIKNSFSPNSPTPESPCIDDCSLCQVDKKCLSICDFQSPSYNCSSNCSLGCLNCYTSSQCQRCQDDLLLEAGHCACPPAFIWDSLKSKCVYGCYSTCTDCSSGPYLCSSCIFGKYLINQLCIDCPSGYTLNITENVCVQNSFLSFQLKFNQSDGIVLDLVSGQKAFVGNSLSFYPDYDSNDPWIGSQGRGFYFNGLRSVVRFNEDFYLFTPEFSFEIWINSERKFGCFLSKFNESGDIFIQVFIENGRVLGKIRTSDDEVVEGNFTGDIEVNYWNLVQVFMRKIGDFEFWVSSLVNGVEFVGDFYFYERYVGDRVTRGLSIGTMVEDDIDRRFKGFIYEIKIFNEFVKNVYKCDNECPVCNSDQECLPNCPILKYWTEGQYNQCSDCNINCINGCRNNKISCNLCDDNLCHNCPNLNNCTKCIENALMGSDMLCKCKSSYYFNGTNCIYCYQGYVKNNECFPCKVLCNSCNQETCLSCITNSVLLNNHCICNLGFTLNSTSSTCSPVSFSVKISVSISNWIYIDFSDELRTNLTSEDILIISKTRLSFSLKIYSKTRFVLVPTNQNDLVSTSSSILYFNRLIISIENGIIHESSYNLTFFPVSKDTESSITKEIKKISNKIVSYLTYATASITLINPTPASLWSFINSIQMLIYIYMFDLDLDERTSGYLLGLRKYNLFPNVFELFGMDYGISHQFPKAHKLGYYTNSFMVNVGEWISCFLFFVFVYYLIYFVNKAFRDTKFRSSRINRMLVQKIKSYKYGFFIRFWIQCYIEFIVSFFLAVLSTDFAIVEQALNFYFAVLFGVRFI